jgi:hypothetical protein
MKTPAPTQVGPRTVQAEFGLLRVLLLAACCILTAGCFGDNEIAPPTIVPDIAAVERSATFSLTIDGASSALSESSHPTLEPSTAPIAIKAPSQLLSLQAFAKRIVHRPDIVWVDLYMENPEMQLCEIRSCKLVALLRCGILPGIRSPIHCRPTRSCSSGALGLMA